MHDLWKARISKSLSAIAANSLDAPVIGSREGEIEALEQKLRIELPASYKLFLKTAGKQPGDFYDGSSCSIDELVDLQDGANAILKDFEQPPLSSNMFVFLEHGGYMFFCMELTAGDEDPPVFFFDEDADGLQNINERFSNWLDRSAREQFPGGVGFD